MYYCFTKILFFIYVFFKIHIHGCLHISTLTKCSSIETMKVLNQCLILRNKTSTKQPESNFNDSQQM